MLQQILINIIYQFAFRFIMKIIILVLALAAVAFANVRVGNPKLRNLYVKPNKKPSGSINPRIINGEEAIPHSIPHQALLTITGREGTWYCGGSLISPSFVLTSASCGKGGDTVEVLLGAHNITNSNEDTQIKVNSKNITVHEQYDPHTYANDICLIELSEAVTLNENINVVKLPSQADVSKTYEGETGRISGWGLHTGFASSLSPVLYQVDVPVISSSKCQGFYNTLVEYEMCTIDDNGRGACYADTGGPFAIGGVQVGVVSYYMDFCISGFPTVYIKTANYLEWIAANSDVQIQ